MKLKKFFIFIIPATIILLIYIHLQMQIFTLAYEGKKKQNKIAKLIERNEDTTSKILTLKSVNNLGIKLLTEKSKMLFAEKTDVLEISSPGMQINEEGELEKIVQARESGPLSNLLSFASREDVNPSR